MTRISVKEAYSNRDLIAQIARLKTYVEKGTFKDVSATYSGGVVTLTFTAYDDSTQSFNIPMDSIVGITGDQVGNTVTLHVEFASGTVVDIPYTIANADTSPTPDTLGLRDGNGKLYAADPASGATDKTLTTANWVSQTGSGRPNNLIHSSGTEDIGGYKIFSGTVSTANVGQSMSRTIGYHKVFNLGSKPTTSQSWYFNFLFNYRYSSTLFYCEAYYDQNSDSFTVVNINGVKTSGIFIDNNYTGNTTIALDIINDEVWVVIHRVTQNNAFSRLTMLSIQRSTNLNTPQKFEVEDTIYTPSGTLSERYIS